MSISLIRYVYGVLKRAAMLIELLSLAGLGWLADRLTSYEVPAGYICRLCGWKCYEPDFHIDNEAKLRAARLFNMHIKDSHPSIDAEQI